MLPRRIEKACQTQIGRRDWNPVYRLISNEISTVTFPSQEGTRVCMRRVSRCLRLPWRKLGRPRKMQLKAAVGSTFEMSIGIRGKATESSRLETGTIGHNFACTWRGRATIIERRINYTTKFADLLSYAPARRAIRYWLQCSKYFDAVPCPSMGFSKFESRIRLENFVP